MRYVLLFIIYLIAVTLIHKKLTNEKDVGLIALEVLAFHMCIAFLSVIIFIFYYFW